MTSAFSDLYGPETAGNFPPMDAGGAGLPVSPPIWLLVVGAAELIVCASVFALGSAAGHVVGYVIGAVVLPITVAAYRQIDRRRARSGRYATPGGVHQIPAPMLVAGVALAMTHAFYLAINKRLA